MSLRVDINTCCLPWLVLDFCYPLCPAEKSDHVGMHGDPFSNNVVRIDLHERKYIE